MIAFAAYILKIILCSGALFLYYHLALRNRVFHQWNRFFLLSAVVLSLSLPLIQLNWVHEEVQAPKAIRLISVAQNADQYMDEFVISNRNHSRPDIIWTFLFIAVSSLVFIRLLVSLRRIRQLVRNNESDFIQGVQLVHTNAAGTPFSFLRTIFWNDEIRLDTPQGRQILEHEFVHIRQWHTLDKLFLQLVLVIFWMNPFFWLIRRELHLVHEFIADEKSVQERDASALAALLLQSLYPQQYNSLVNSFFHSPVKRRLFMLSKINVSRMHYLTRLIALPVMAFVIFSFTLRTHRSHLALAREYVVVIDAGHGKMENGTMNGAHSGDVYEDNIVLSLAQTIRKINANQKLKIILTRSADEIVSLQQRVAIAKENHADLFISLHMNAVPAQQTSGKNGGIEICLPKAEHPFRYKSQVLASGLVDELKDVFAVVPEITTREGGIYVIRESGCPSVLIECGYVTNTDERNFMMQARNQEKVALKILRAVERYMAMEESGNLQTPVAAPAKDAPAPVAAAGKTNKTKTETTETNLAGTPVFTKAEKDPSIDQDTWRQFLMSKLPPIVEELSQKVADGSYQIPVRFVVDKDGSLSSITVEGNDYGIGSSIISMMKQSPKWKPAMQNHRIVRAYHVQPLTFVITESKVKANGSTARSIPITPIPELLAKTVQELVRVRPTDEVISFTAMIDLDNGDIRAIEYNKAALAKDALASIMEQLKPGKMLTIENIRIRRDGAVVKWPSQVYGL